MKKIPTILQRDYSRQPALVTDEVNPEALWVFNGEGVATRKYDGGACMFDGTTWFKRRELRDSDIANKGFPEGWIEADHDATTAKRTGWVPIGDGPEDKYMREAIADYTEKMTGHPDEHVSVTCEFLGPKSQGNVEKVGGHMMLPHSYAEKYPECPRTYSELKAWLADKDIEGIVWHHPDGRMAKVKLKDFGLRRPKP